MLELHIAKFETPEVECEFEELDTYHRLHIYRHLGSADRLSKIFGVLDNLLSVKNIYK